MHFITVVKMELPVNLFAAQERQRKFPNPKGIRALQVDILRQELVTKMKIQQSGMEAAAPALSLWKHTVALFVALGEVRQKLTYRQAHH